MKKNIFVPSKGEYVRGNRPKVECILCSIVRADPQVINLEVFRSKNFVVAVNLYPYNPGHLMIFPHQHLKELEELSFEEAKELHQLTLLTLKILKKIYQPHGFNLGYNLGRGSGASIEHLHLHIVPRYENELSFMDILGGAKVIIEDPVQTMKKLKKEFEKNSF